MSSLTAMQSPGKAVNKSIRYAALAVFCLALSGCSTFGFLFERLAWLSSWQFDRMFGLDQAQQQTVRIGADNMARWLSESGFPALIEELETARSLWDKGQHAETIDLLERTLDDSRQQFMQTLSPWLTSFLMSLNEYNAEHFRRYNQQHLREWYEYADSSEAKLDFRLEQLSRWFGRLSDTQVQQISEAVTVLPTERQVRIDNNQAWTERMLDVSLARDEQAIQAWLQNPDSWWIPAFREQHEKNRLQILKAIEAIITTMTPRQEKKFGKRLDKWIRTLDSVSKR